MFLCGIMFSRFVLYALSCNVVIAYCVFLCFLWLCGQVAVVLGAYINYIYARETHRRFSFRVQRMWRGTGFSCVA